MPSNNKSVSKSKAEPASPQTTSPSPELSTLPETEQVLEAESQPLTEASMPEQELPLPTPEVTQEPVMESSPELRTEQIPEPILEPIQPLAIELKRSWTEIEPARPLSVEERPVVAAVEMHVAPKEMISQQLTLQDWTLALKDDPSMPAEWTTQWLMAPQEPQWLVTPQESQWLTAPQEMSTQMETPTPEQPITSPEPMEAIAPILMLEIPSLESTPESTETSISLDSEKTTEPEAPTQTPELEAPKATEPLFPGLTTEVENLPEISAELMLPLASGAPISTIATPILESIQDETTDNEGLNNGAMVAMSPAPKNPKDSHLEEEASNAMTSPENTLAHDESAANDSTVNSLEAAAQDWAQDDEESLEASAETTEAEESEDATSETAESAPADGSDAATGPVTFIADPYGMNSLEVQAAQNDEGFVADEDSELSDETDENSESEDEEEDQPLELHTDEAELSETLQNLQSAMEKEEKALADEAAENAQHAEEEAQALLARQIKEDEELERAMKEQAENDLTQDPELLAALPKMPVEDDDGNLDLAELQSCIESLLFMVEKPMSAKKLHELLGPEMPLHLFQEALTQMKARYQRLHHGFELVEVAGGYQFRTKPVRAALAKKLAKIQTQRLSTGAMETLAIIAYKQPAMKEDIDKIRGVDSSHFIRGLLDKKLIKISGRSELPGRPMLYATTQEFMEVFTLKNLEELPPLKEIESMVPGSQSGGEDPRVVQMRELVGEMKADTSVSLLYDPKEDEKFLSDIKERVQGISITTATLEEQKAREKAIKEGLIDPNAEKMEQAMKSVAPGETPEMPL